jgi:hypothetical protein
MRIGRLIAAIKLLMLIAWQLCLMLLLRRLRPGQRRQRRRVRPSSPSRLRVWLNVCGPPVVNEAHWISDSAAVQLIHREGMSDLYVGSLGCGSQAFYSLNDLADWFVECGLDPEDPAWDYIEQLDQQEANATESDEP